jgi:hypothetical protein
MIIAVFLLPSYVSATTDQTQSIIISGNSEHSSQYDNVVNVGNDTSIMNPTTWNPTYQGLWIGGSTEESKFQLNQVTTNDSRLVTSSYFKFTNSQIMDGVGEYMIRSPISVNSYMNGLELLVYTVSSPLTDSFTVNTGALDRFTFAHSSTDKLIYSLRVDPAITSITNPSNYYTVDDRTYVLLYMPILPNVYYNFVWVASYDADGRMTVYFTPNDIASDGLHNSSLYTYIKTTPIDYLSTTNTVPVEMGISFDMRVGLANNIFAHTMFMAAGSEMSFVTNYPGGTNLTGYQSISIPFFTTTGNATVAIEVSKYLDPSNVFWSVGSRSYRNNIVASSGSAISATIWGPDVYFGGAWVNSGDLFIIRINSTIDQNIQWLFINQNDNEDVAYYAAGYDTALHIGVLTFNYGYHLMNSYAISTNQIAPPDCIYPGGQVISGGVSWQPRTILGVLAFVLYTSAKALVTQGWSGPLAGLTGIVSTLAAAPIAGLGAMFWLQDQAIGLIIDTANAVVNGVYPLLKNGIDAAWSALQGLGRFLWSVGEGIWGALTILWNGLVEYGSILLGLLIVGVAMMLFFWPIKVEVQMLNAFLLMAQGKFEQGANVGYSVGKKVTDAFSRGGNKVIRRLK